MASSSSLTAHQEVCWRLLLQHWEPLDQGVVYRLLATSSALTALVHATAANRLCVRLHNSPAADAQERWLTKHRGIVAELVWEQQQCQQQHCAGEGQQQQSCKPSLSSVKALVLQQQQRLLQKLRRPARSSLAPPFLLGVAAADLRHIRRLDWPVSTSSCRSRAISKALQQLTALQHLSLRCVDSASGTGPAAFDGSLARAVQELTSLTALQLQHFTLSRASTQLLPRSLRQLSVGRPLPRLAARALRDQQLQLAHLTNLQRLQLHSLKGCDRLPVGLRELRVGHISLLPLLPLKQLQLLAITEGTQEAVLRQLRSSLPRLTELHLVFNGPWSLSAVGFLELQQLPLKQLQCRLYVDQLQVLPALVHLTSLRLQVEAPAASSRLQQQLAEQLQPLTNLKELVVRTVLQQQQMPQMPQRCVIAAAAEQQEEEAVAAAAAGAAVTAAA